MPLRKAEYEMLAGFRYTLRRFLGFSERSAARVGLTHHQYQALLAVRAHPGPGLLSISQLADQMLIKHHSAVGMVDRLEQLGLVRREPSAEDRRKVCVRLTASGRKVFARLAEVHRAELRRIGPDLARFTEYFRRAPAESARPASKR